MIIKFIIRLLLYALAIIVMARFVPGIAITSYTSAILVALLWGLIGVTLRPILVLLTLPINFLSLGLFTFILNALLFWFVALLAPGFTVSGFIPALEGSVLLSIVGFALHAVL